MVKLKPSGRLTSLEYYPKCWNTAPNSIRIGLAKIYFTKKYRTIGKTNKFKLLFVYNIVLLGLKSNGILNANILGLPTLMICWSKIWENTEKPEKPQSTSSLSLLFLLFCVMASTYVVRNRIHNKNRPYIINFLNEQFIIKCVRPQAKLGTHRLQVVTLFL